MQLWFQKVASSGSALLSSDRFTWRSQGLVRGVGKKGSSLDWVWPVRDCSEVQICISVVFRGILSLCTGSIALSFFGCFF